MMIFMTEKKKKMERWIEGGVPCMRRPETGRSAWANFHMRRWCCGCYESCDDPTSGDLAGSTIPPPKLLFLLWNKIENVNIKYLLPVFNIKIKKILHHHITFSFSLIMNCDISQTLYYDTISFTMWIHK